MEYFETGSKKGRGRAQRSLDLIEAMRAVAEAAQPITGRGIGYKLFTAGLIPSMGRSDMQRVYRLLKQAREEGAFRGSGSWTKPAVSSGIDLEQSHRIRPRRLAILSSDFWNQQPYRARYGARKAPCGVFSLRCWTITQSASA